MEAVPSYSEHPWVRFYEAGIPAHLEYPEITLGEVLSGTVSKFPDHTALLFFGKRISYGQLDELVNRFAQALVGLGVTKGDRVALMLPNIPQMVIAYYGTLRTGAIAVATAPRRSWPWICSTR
jgi:long-chain acyl-CoA synthetase